MFLCGSLWTSYFEKVSVRNGQEVETRFSHLTVNRIRSGYDAAPGIERGVDARLGDCDRLLLHDLVDRDTIHVAHLVELIDAYHTTVREDHSTSLESAFARVLVHRHCSRETDTGATSAGGGNCKGCGVEYKPEDLRLCSRRVSNHEHVDIATDMRAVWQVLLRTTQ